MAKKMPTRTYVVVYAASQGRAEVGSDQDERWRTACDRNNQATLLTSRQISSIKRLASPSTSALSDNFVVKVRLQETLPGQSGAPGRWAKWESCSTAGQSSSNHGASERMDGDQLWGFLGRMPLISQDKILISNIAYTKRSAPESVLL